MMSSKARRAAEILEQADRGSSIVDLPADMQPTTIHEAYAIQDARSGSANEIGGWKVSVTGIKEEPVCAPISATRHYRSGDSFSRGLPLIEVEIAFVIGEDLPPRATPYASEDILSAIASTHVALELVKSRFVDRKAVSPLAALADNQSNEGTVVGDGARKFADLDFAHAKVSASVNGVAVASVTDGSGKDDILRSLAWLANHTGTRYGGLRAGQVILTGARIRPFPVQPGDQVSGHVDGIGDVILNIAAAASVD